MAVIVAKGIVSVSAMFMMTIIFETTSGQWKPLHTAHLASTSAFRFGSYSAGKGLVYFVGGGLKDRVARRWAEWRRTTVLEPSQRPVTKPKPWKLQVYDYDILSEWLVGAVANGPTAAGAEAIAEAERPHPLEGKAWPIIVTFRGSEESHQVKDV